MTPLYYFIQKEGVYPQGVYWIGSDEATAASKLVELAQSDRDSYHYWVLYEYNPLGTAHTEIRRCKKGFLF